MFNQDTLFSVPIDKLDNWSFNSRVADVFPDMIHRSIPGYSSIIYIIGIIVQHFVKPNTYIYDLGCSFGSSTLSIQDNIQSPGCTIIAVDNSQDMVKCCFNYVNKFYNKNITPVKILEANICDINIENASLVILNFTLQFIEPSLRLKLLKKIWQGLYPGGALLLSEKFSFKDIKISTILSNMHYNFKRNNGYSDMEINQKIIMLKNVMFTDTIETHKMRLYKAGFINSEVCFQNLNFGSIIALK